jgi:Tol biopolymer transport system component
MKNDFPSWKISLISMLLILPACVVQPSVVNSPSPNPAITASNPRVIPTLSSPTESQTPAPTAIPTVKPTAYPLPQNTNFDRKIIFLYHVDLFAINSDGSGRIKLAQVSNVYPTIKYPIISVDGTKVFYHTFDGLFQINIDGTSNKKIFPPNIDEHFPFGLDGNNLSRDGKKLVFAESANSLVVYDLESDSIKELNIDGNNPSFSPDGNKIVFFVDDGSNVVGQYQLYTINSDGTDLKRITNDKNNYLYPQWSPDGTRIYSCFGNREKGGLYSMKPDGSDIKEVIGGIGSNVDFSISPDGNKIAYNIGNLYIANMDGTNIQQLGPPHSGDATWSPDSKKIAFVNVRDINVINVDGTNQVKITDETKQDTDGISFLKW